MLNSISALSPNITPLARSAQAGLSSSTAKADKAGDTSSPETPSGAGQTEAGLNAKDGFSSEELREIASLKTADSQVRSHEAAHLAAAAGIAQGGAHFEYRTGPDGKRYAVAGEVSIVAAAGRTPEETLRRAEQIRRAALAPADPSGQDLAVAAQASQMEMRARAQIAAESVAAAKAGSASAAYKSAADNFSPKTSAISSRILSF